MMPFYQSLFLIVKKQAAVYTAERFVLQKTFLSRFIIKSGFKSRAGYNGVRTVYCLARIIVYFQVIQLMFTTFYK